MDTNVDNRRILWSLLATPADTGGLYTANLEQMVADHPQSGLLQVLLARAGDKADIKKAAVYFKAGTLYKLTHHPDVLPAVAPDKINSSNETALLKFFNNPVEEQDADAGVAKVDENPVIAEDAELIDNTWDEAAAQPEEEVVNTDFGNEPVDKENAEQVAENDGLEPIVAGDEAHETADATDTIIPELYHSYTEQLADPRVDEVSVSDMVLNDENTIIPKLYDSDTGKVAGPQADEAPGPDVAEEVVGNDIQQPEVTNSPEITTKLIADEGYKEEEEYFRQDIDDEIYDEIVSIDDIGFEPVVNVLHEVSIPGETEPKPFAQSSDNGADEAGHKDDEHPLAVNGMVNNDTHTDEQKMIMGNIVSADYLSFDSKLDELRKADTNLQHTAMVQSSTTGAATVGKDSNEISRYNDDTLPYSFMWWLDKTRKEHADNLQPYAQPIAAKQADRPDADKNYIKPVKRVAPDELQQQYYENIFSLTSVSSIERDESSSAIAFDHTKKENIIIERFINTEPQIKPPAANKLDNENKAKKSSEDMDALVTETLARIYTDQMLYHKAIATYKKLVLKFPEKKLYFASQIEQLEKKTN